LQVFRYTTDAEAAAEHAKRDPQGSVQGVQLAPSSAANMNNQ